MVLGSVDSFSFDEDDVFLMISASVVVSGLKGKDCCWGVNLVNLLGFLYCGCPPNGAPGFLV